MIERENNLNISINKITKWGMFREVIMELIVDSKLKNVQYPKAHQFNEIIKSWCKKKQITNEEELKLWKKKNGFNDDQWNDFITRKWRWTNWCLDEFAERIPNYYLEKKAMLDKAKYSLIRVTSENLANELYIRIKEQEEQVKDILQELEIVSAKIDTQKQYINKLQERSDIEIESEIKKVTDNTEAIDKYNTHIQALQSEISKLQKDTVDKQSLSDKSNKLRNFEAQFESKLKECNKHKSFYENNDNCPTCNQALQNKQSMIADNNQQIMKWNQALEDADREIQSLSKRLEKIQNIETEIRTVEIDVAKFEQSKIELHNINTKLTHKINELKQQSSDTGEARGKLQELEKQEVEADKKKQDKKEELDYLQAAKVMLNDTGIKTKVIKQYLPIMNQLINKYLASMDFFVNFRLDNEFKETIRSRFRDEFSYASFSEGEKMRINLALLFTWRAIAKMKNSISCNLLLLDEIFDSSLDGTGTDDFLKILNTLEGENVFIISHKTDMIADRFANVMRFEKAGNFTKIVD